MSELVGRDLGIVTEIDGVAGEVGSILELDDHPLLSDGEFESLDVAIEGGSAEKGDIDTRLTGEIALVCVVVC